MAKPKIHYQENYKKGAVVELKEIQRMIDENLEDIVVEIKKRTIYTDNTEGLILEFKLPIK